MLNRKIIFQAVQEGDIDTFSLVLPYYPDLNFYQTTEYMMGCTLLYMAAIKGHTKIAQILIENGAEVDKGSDCESTPLSIACIKGHTKIAELLICAGANVNLRNFFDSTPLVDAVNHNRVAILKLLIAAKVTIPYILDPRAGIHVWPRNADAVKLLLSHLTYLSDITEHCNMHNSPHEKELLLNIKAKIVNKRKSQSSELIPTRSSLKLNPYMHFPAVADRRDKHVAVNAEPNDGLRSSPSFK